MPLCLGKKDSIKSATTRLWVLLTAWKREGKIDDQELQLAKAMLARIERCSNIEKTYDTDK